jgi:hypothetical protein
MMKHAKKDLLIVLTRYCGLSNWSISARRSGPNRPLLPANEPALPDVHLLVLLDERGSDRVLIA